MQLMIFIFMLVLHLFFCKYVLKSFTLPFSIYGIIWFVVLIFMRLPIIEFTPFNDLTMIIFLSSYFALLIPHIFVSKKKLLSILKGLSDIRPIKEAKVLYKWLFLISFVLTGLYVYFMARHYGGIMFILRNSYYVRYDAMGQQIVPLAITYGLGIGYVAAGFGSYLLFFSKTTTFQKLYYILPFFFAVGIDILTSSRMGILFYAIIYFSSLLLKYNCISVEEKRRYRRILFFGLVLALIILFVPKYLRDASVGGSDYSSYTKYLVNQDLNKFPLIGPFMHYFTYITGPLAAFDEYVITFTNEFSMGEAQFLPLVHIFTRLFGGESNYDILYEFVSVPFSTNIYSYLREAYSDFGFIGILLTPFMLGLLSLIASRLDSKNKLLNFGIFQYVYLYCIFSIFYTPFSQGGPTIGFFIYILILIYLNLKKQRKVVRREINGQLYYRVL